MKTKQAPQHHSLRVCSMGISGFFQVVLEVLGLAQGEEMRMLLESVMICSAVIPLRAPNEEPVNTFGRQ